MEKRRLVNQETQKWMCGFFLGFLYLSISVFFYAYMHILYIRYWRSQTVLALILMLVGGCICMWVMRAYMDSRLTALRMLWCHRIFIRSFFCLWAFLGSIFVSFDLTLLWLWICTPAVYGIIVVPVFMFSMVCGVPFDDGVCFRNREDVLKDYGGRLYPAFIFAPLLPFLLFALFYPHTPLFLLFYFSLFWGVGYVWGKRILFSLGETKTNEKVFFWGLCKEDWMDWMKMWLVLILSRVLFELSYKTGYDDMYDSAQKSFSRAVDFCDGIIAIFFGEGSVLLDIHVYIRAFVVAFWSGVFVGNSLVEDA